MKRSPFLILTLTLTVGSAAFAPADAAIIVVAPSAGSPGSLQVTADINFAITTAGRVKWFLFDEWVVSDGAQSVANSPSGFSYSQNGGAPASQSGFFLDNMAATGNDFTPNDGLIILSVGVVVAPGDTFTLKAGLYGVQATSSFNPQGTQTFTGNMFVTNDSGVRLSGNVLVPEPTALALCGLGSLVLARRQRRPAVRQG